jgi:beta-glucosidase
MDKYKSKFPKDFYWGASTASHQVEGGNHNQWSVWELSVASQQAKTAEERLSWIAGWKDVKTQAENPQNYISGQGVDHYRKYKEDFALAEKINLNAMRFGIEWARIQPEEDVWDEKEIAHYKKYIREMRSRGLEPFLNIWHWTAPVWFEEKGGFKKGANIKYFEKFVQKIADELLTGVNHVITLNEPNVFTSFSYVTGEWPPEEKNWLSAMSVYWNLVNAHRRAYKILKKKKPTLQIGVAAQLANIQAKRPHNIIDGVATKWMRYFWNWWFLNRIKHQQDFIGFNYYFTDYYKHFKRDNPSVPLNDLGWYMEPEGLYPILLRIHAHYKKPIIVTENGVADADDQYRQWWLQETMIAMERALSEGVELKGYLHWSLLDNFEWAYGWWPKFGLIEVERKNGMKRKVRESAKWYAKRIAQERQK